ncbi:unnamed protein product [Ectocarpus sp. 13 AM-2016]
MRCVRVGECGKPARLSFFPARSLYLHVSTVTPHALGQPEDALYTAPLLRDDIECLLSLRDNGGRGALCEQRNTSGQCTLPLSGVNSGRVDHGLEANTKTELIITATDRS